MNDTVVADRITHLLKLGKQARHALNAKELAFLAVNDTHYLTPYRQAALWDVSHGVDTLSGVIDIESNGPYVQFLNRLCSSLGDEEPVAIISKGDVPEDLAKEWGEWLPPFVLWLPLKDNVSGALSCGLLYARDMPWTEMDKALMSEWADTWGHAWLSKNISFKWSIRKFKDCIINFFPNSSLPWWKQKRFIALIIILGVLLFPVRLSVLVPGELVSAHPAIIRSPLDGVIEKFDVEPNETVKTGQTLFTLDEAEFRSRYQSALEELTSAQAEYRQKSQMLLNDEKARLQLPTLQGRIEVANTEVKYLKNQLTHAKVNAPQEGIVIFDDPSEWIGKPVVMGEKIMRIASPSDVEVEAWIPVGDAIPLEGGMPVQLYLNASPLFSVKAKIRYVAFDPILRPEGGYAYRVRATINDEISYRVGMKGTARLNGHRVPFIYWMLRKPLATIRTTLGW